MPKGEEIGSKVKTKPRVERNRVLVTGGAGFVGSHLCDYLVARGDHVRACCGTALLLLCLPGSRQHGYVAALRAGANGAAHKTK